MLQHAMTKYEPSRVLFAQAGPMMIKHLPSLHKVCMKDFQQKHTVKLHAKQPHKPILAPTKGRQNNYEIPLHIQPRSQALPVKKGDSLA